MNKWIYDLEVFSNYFCISFKEFKQDNWKKLEIHGDTNHVDMCSMLFNFLKQRHMWIAFNSQHYDDVVLHWMYQHYKKYALTEIFLSDLKKFSDSIINDDYDTIKPYKYNNNILQGVKIDLFLFWSKGLRISKKLSLKTLAIQLNHDRLQELPYEPYTYLTREQQLEVYNYCDNDVIVTEKVAIKLEDSNSPKTGSIVLRFDVAKRYGLNCYSWDTPKIASETLALSFANKTNSSVKDITSLRYEKPPVIYIKDVLTNFEPNFKTKTFKDFYDRLLKSTNKFSDEFIYRQNDTTIKLSYGIGGIHSVNKHESYYESEYNYLITSDVASLYPTNIINHNTIRFPQVLEEYITIRKERLIAKANKDKATDKFKKLKLNSVSGLLDSEYSWLHYPEGALKLRLIGQLQLTKLIEEASLQIPDCKVVSANTKTLVF